MCEFKRNFVDLGYLNTPFCYIFPKTGQIFQNIFHLLVSVTYFIIKVDQIFKIDIIFKFFVQLILS